MKFRDGAYQICHKLDKYERLELEEFKSINSGTVKGLVPITMEQKRKKLKLIARMANAMPLDIFCKAYVDADSFLTIISTTLQIAMECERRGLRPNSLCWESTCIFLDNETGAIRMLYWPVLRLNSSDAAMMSFYQSFLELMYRDHLDAGLTKIYSSYFYQREHITLTSFQATVNSMVTYWGQKRQINTDVVRPQERPNRAASNVQKKTAWLESATDGKRIWIDREQIILGRINQENGITIYGDDSVSRRHARIFRRGDCFYIEDLRSKNGTYIRETMLRPGMPVELQNGDIVRIGDSVFLFHKLIPDETISIYQLRKGTR